MTTIEPGVVERVVEALARLDESRKGWEAGERIDGDEAVCILRLGTVRPIEEAARKVPSLLALLAQQQARIGELLLVAGNAAEQFRAYERHHRAKAEGIEPVGRGFVITAQRDAILNKAERNRQMAEMCEAAIAKEPT